MFDNSFTFSIGGSNRVLTRVNQDKFSSLYRYRSAAMNIDLAIRHTDRPTPGKAGGAKTERHNVEMTITKFTVVDGVTISNVYKAYFVMELETGTDDEPARQGMARLAETFIDATGVMARLIQWES